MPATSPATSRAQVIRVTAIAFLCQNVCSGAVYGPFGVMVAAVETKYGVTRELSTLALPLMSGMLALCAPFVGVLAERVSLRLLMIIGSILGAIGYTVLALIDSIAVYLAVYALLFGPSMCLGSVVVPSTLVTRWFDSHRGRALGVVHMPLLIGPIALSAAFLLRDQGLTVIYAALAGLYLVNICVVSFAKDPPPLAKAAAHPGTASARPDALPLRQVLTSRTFWLITLAFAAILSGSVVTSGQLVAMAAEWRIETTIAATLFTGMSLVGLIGTPTIGWVIDKLGASATMALLCVDCGLLWFVVMAQPPVPVLVVAVLLMGFHGGATMPVFSSACAEAFGADAFSRTFGLAKMMTLPFTLLAVPSVAAIYVNTGSYRGAQAMLGCFLLAAGFLIVLTLFGRRNLRVKTA